MTEHIKVAYENIGSSSYLTVTFGPEAGLIEYQLGMITSNEICHLLASTKRTINGATVAYYNISSRAAKAETGGVFESDRWSGQSHKRNRGISTDGLRTGDGP